ncbi:MAG: site-specific DNA-methyltransferase [Chthonomonas sp.]|nr:site-specific DNA-methyltransferase [Chthonomonas sp.]
MPPQTDIQHNPTCLLLPGIVPSYRTELGMMVQGKSEEVIQTAEFEKLRGKVQLIFTSPPFPLNRKKKYGNLQGEEYLNWIASFAPKWKELLTPTGSIVIELGNAWEQGSPVMSTLALETLIKFKQKGRLKLCQQFIAYNPARLPSPAEWVTVQRIRVKDSYTNVWWMSPTAKPKANNRNVLTEYSDAMKHLLKTGAYNSGKRPSEFAINETSFLNDNGGAIPGNVLRVANTRGTDEYLRYCAEHNLPLHPARMAYELPEFFIKFLTDPGDLVLDPFGGSNTTGATAERLGRQWISVELDEDYIAGSMGRFSDKLVEIDDSRTTSCALIGAVTR